MNFPAPLTGIVPPVVTPLTDLDSLDVGGLERLLARLLQGGCSGVFVLGSTGEAQGLSYRLRLEMVRETCRIVAGAVPVLAGITDTSIVESIAFGRAAVDAGASAVVTAQPYYLRVSQEDLVEHARALAEGVNAPLFLYNMPSLTKLQYDPETVAAAAEIPGVAGFKDSSADLIYFQRVLQAVRGKTDFSVLMGPEELLAQAVFCGAHGGVTGGANLRPDLYVQLYEAARAGRMREAIAMQDRVVQLADRLYRVGDPATSYIRGLKCALGLEGICSDLPAAPLRRLDAAERQMIADAVREFAPATVDV
jgi:4-hydroxy-tetrahydrodipicolinate synthase